MENLKPRSGHFHAVRFYENEHELCRIVADFLSGGLAVGQPAIVVATPKHRDGIAKRFDEIGLDIGELQRSGELVLRDAREMLAFFMVDGMPDSGRFNTAMSRLIQQACRGRDDRPVSVYGEMVDVLWKDGNQEGAMRLELLWNQLAASHDFSLLCGYAVGSFYKGASRDEICSQHSHVLSDAGVATAVN